MDVYAKAVKLAGAGEPFAMALIIETEGSTPRKAGVRAIVDATGEIFGTIGGGAVEADVQRYAVEACASGTPVVLELDLLDASANDPGPICGGSLRIVIDPTASKDAAAYARAASNKVISARREAILRVSMSFKPYCAVSSDTATLGRSSLADWISSRAISVSSAYWFVI